MTDEHLVAVDLAQVDLRADPDSLPFEPPGREHHDDVGRPRRPVARPRRVARRRRARDEEDSIQRELEDALADHHHSIVDVSANRIVFDLTDGLDLLSGGCGLDLDPSRWRPGMCAQTLFGQAQVILHQLDERTTRVFVRPSFAEYFVDRLGAAQPVS